MLISWVTGAVAGPVAHSIDAVYIDIDTLYGQLIGKAQHQRVMAKRSSDPVHCWLIWRKAHEAASDYLYRGIAETGISDTDFRVLEALLHKGPLPVNTIGPKVHLTPGSISVAVDRLLEKGLVSRAESPDDRRVRVVALTKSGKDLIVPIFRKHSAEIARVFADANSKELQILESVLKKAGQRAKALAEERSKIINS
jgi:MarR family 2-MHQ and catechol resistance regulon transcriptional repressor